MKNIYEQITQRIIEQLENSVVPWKSPYLSKVGFPQNFSTQKEYRGINVLLLGSLRFTSPFFLTFLQAKELGGSVRKGERGHLVVKYGTYEQGVEGESASADPATAKRGFLKAYTVFHASQIEGVDFPKPDALPELSISEKTDRARAIVTGMPKRPPVEEGSAIPCYRPGSDSVHMPEKRYFVGEEAYYSTLFHELAHATGHTSRLARKSFVSDPTIQTTGETSRKAYAEEELVAEMAASFLNAHAGIVEDELPNSAAYLQGWAETLRGKDATSWVVRAASEGQKATDFILGRL